jgi:hypothetical protein
VAAVLHGGRLRRGRGDRGRDRGGLALSLAGSPALPKWRRSDHFRAHEARRLK